MSTAITLSVSSRLTLTCSEYPHSRQTTVEDRPTSRNGGLALRERLLVEGAAEVLGRQVRVLGSGVLGTAAASAANRSAVSYMSMRYLTLTAND